LGEYPAFMIRELGPFSIDRVCSAVQKVRDRLFRAAAALDGAGVRYAVVGGNAVALWVSRVDDSAVRATQDVDILVRRSDFAASRAALEAAGFIYRHSSSIDMFLDGPGAKARDGVHLLYANERVRPDQTMLNPDVDESERADRFTVVALAGLVRLKLSSFRDKDRTHLRDLIGVGLLGARDVAGLDPVLAERLQGLLDTPEG